MSDTKQNIIYVHHQDSNHGIVRILDVWSLPRLICLCHSHVKNVAVVEGYCQADVPLYSDMCALQTQLGAVGDGAERADTRAEGESSAH